jgi:hypothetical protein
VANCLRYGHIINIEARCLHGSCDDVPPMRDYVAAALRLRRALFDLIWDSQLSELYPAQVEANRSVKYCRHVSRVRPGGEALVLNHFESTPQTARVALPHRSVTSATVYTIRGPEQRINLPAEILIAPDDLAIVVPD